MKTSFAYHSKFVIAVVLSIIASGLYSPLKAQTAPSTYSAYTGTDAKTVPPAPALGPANSAIKDPTFGSRILRVTDANTLGGESFISTDAGSHRSWNANSTAIKLSGPHGDGYWLEFSPSSFKVGDGSASPKLHSLPFGATWEWSTIDPDIMYFLNGNQIGKYNKSTGVKTNIGGPSSGEPLAYFAVVIGQDNWICAAAGAGNQDSYTKIYCVNPTSPSVSRYIDVVNKTVNGVAQSDPHWPTSAAGQVIGIHGISGGTGANWLPVTFHQQSWGGNGDAVFDFATNTWSLVSNADAYWSGHISMGNGVYANASGSTNGVDSRGMILRNPDNLMSPSQYKFVGQPTSPWNSWCDADHNSWLNSLTNPNAPILSSRYLGGPGCKFAWTGEIIGIATDGSNTVWRFAHNHNGGSVCYYAQGFAQISNDGKWALFSSYWDGTLGSDTAFGCGTRIDTFIVELVPSSGTSSSDSGSGTTTGSGSTSGASGGTTSSGATTGGTTTGGTTSGGTTSGGTTSGTGTSTPPTTTGTVTRIEQNGTGVTYTGPWSTNSGSFNSGGSAALSMDSSASATVAFTGTGATWIGYQDQWSGIAQVYVDGALKAQVDTYASTNKAKSPIYSVSGLSSGAHTMTIKVMGQKNASSSGLWVWVDAFDIASGTSSSASTGSASTSTGSTGSTSTGGTSTSTTPGTTRVEQNSGGIVYSGGTWYPNTASFNSGGSSVLASDAGARATFTFNGTGVNWIAYRDEWSGIARVYVDGTPVSTVDTYSTPSKAQTVAYSVSGLASGSHTLIIEATGTKSASSGGTWIWIDAFDVISGAGSTGSSSGNSTSTGSTGSTSTGSTSSGSNSTSAATSQNRVEQSSAAVVWSGSWSVNNGMFNSGSSAKLSMTAGSRATFKFTGTSVSWIAYRDEWSGIARVYIDGTLKATVDTYAHPAMATTVAYTMSNLPPGTHTIAIEAAGSKNSLSGGSWVWVDAFDYVGAALTSALSTPDTNPSNAALGGGVTLTSSGGLPLPSVGSAEITGPGGTALSGLALISYRQNGVVATEAGVPASVPVLRGRILAEINSSLNTGFAIANPNDSQATVSFFFTDTTGKDSGLGSLTLPPHGQLSRFLNENPFNANQSTFGTLTFSSDIPVSAIALRGRTNERSEFLLTTLPVADPDVLSSATSFFPHYADGGGWKTQFVLVNPTDAPMTGILNFVQQDGKTADSVPYEIAPRSVWRYTTPNLDPTIHVASAQAIAEQSTPAPEGTAILSYEHNGILVSEAGVPSLETGTAFRLFFESSAAGEVRTGVGIVNSSENATTAKIELVGLDGSATGLTGTLSIPAFGQRALFLDETPGFETLPKPFKGFVRISSVDNSDLAVVGLRGRTNERAEFLVTTTPPVNENSATASNAIFPHFANGGGFSTEFVMYGVNSDLTVHDQNGAAVTMTWQ